MPYTLTLTAEEYRALGWLAARYTSARAVFDGMEAADDGTAEGDGAGTYRLAEHAAWAFLLACDDEDGGFVPCCGGALAGKLRALLDTIV